MYIGNNPRNGQIALLFIHDKIICYTSLPVRRFLLRVLNLLKAAVTEQLILKQKTICRSLSQNGKNGSEEKYFLRGTDSVHNYYNNFLFIKTPYYWSIPRIHETIVPPFNSCRRYSLNLNMPYIAQKCIITDVYQFRNNRTCPCFLGCRYIYVRHTGYLKKINLLYPQKKNNAALHIFVERNSVFLTCSLRILELPFSS